MSKYCAMILIFSLLTFVTASGQETKTADEIDRAEKGEALMLALTRQRELLPNRWACSIEYDIETTPDQEKIVWIKGKQYIAEDKELETKVLRREESDSQRDGAGALGEFEIFCFDWIHQNEKLRWNDGKWGITKVGEKRRHIDPYMLCVASSDILDSGIDENYVQVCFFGVRSCLELSVGKKETNTAWGLPRRAKNGFASCWFVTHDGQSGLPISFKSRFYDQWDHKNLNSKSKLINSVETKWQAIKELNIVVPVEVNSEWMNEENLEAMFTIRWMFGDDVPDSAFVDPRIEPLVIPDFSIKSGGK